MYGERVRVSHNKYTTNPALRQKDLAQVARYAANLLLMMKPQN
jgi:hypothetical protein